MSSSTPKASTSSYVCDTLPPPRLAANTSAARSPSPPPLPTPPVTAFHAPIIDEASLNLDAKRGMSTESVEKKVVSEVSTGPPARKLCVRHQRMADEGTNLKLQQALDKLPVEEREAVNAVWSNFSSSPHPRRALILQGLLTMCCFSQLSLLTEQLAYLIRIDPFTVLPREVSLKILGYLDATSLCRAAQVSRQWKSLADDDILWRGICEQHIGQKCLKCGWGLPLLERRRAIRVPSPSPCSSPSVQSPPLPEHHHQHPHPSYLQAKRDRESGADNTGPVPSTKRARLDVGPSQASLRSPPIQAPFPSLSPLPHLLLSDSSRTSTPNPLVPPQTSPPSDAVTRPWKDVYCERLTIERNWRRGRCTVRTLKGHTDGVMCLQFSETLTHPAFPILITGSYDRTARVWNLDTGKELHCLHGHTRAVRALQFDEVKLITGSMDHTIKVWDWRTGKCLRTLEGHTEGVVCLNFDSNVLASGSVDSTVKVWNFRTGECFTLRGHRDWVNAVQLWDSGSTDAASFRSPNTVVAADEGRPSSPSFSAHIDPGKMLFSASDDGTIRLWDLSERSCVRQFSGHVGQVQSLKLLIADQGCDESEGNETTPTSSQDAPVEEAQTQEIELRSTIQSELPGLAPANVSLPGTRAPGHPGFASPVFTPPPGFNPFAYIDSPSTVPPTGAFIHPEPTSADKGKERAASEPERPKSANRAKRPVLISGSLDNTIKIWDIDSGKAVRTLFGHIEGVWAVASDNLRLVSGSHDRTIKVWNREEGRCTATLVGHRGAVTCLALGDDKIVSGSDDGDVRYWSFSG